MSRPAAGTPLQGVAPLGMPPEPSNPAKPPDTSAPPVSEQDEHRRSLARRFKSRIKFFGQKLKSDHYDRWKKNRRHVNGEEGEDGSAGLVRTNLVASVVNTIQPNIYAKAPEVSVQPQERPTQSYPPMVRGFARTLELALNRFAIRDSMLKARGKEAVRSSLTCTTGWVKVIYQRDVREDPLVRNRINDEQDNIERIQSLIRETKDEAECAEYEAKLAELGSLVAALEQKVEVDFASGVVIDNVLPEHILILDASIRTIDEYAQASAIAHGVYMTAGAYKVRFKDEPPRRATRYGTGVEDAHGGGQVEDDGRSTQGIDADDELVLVWEIWSKDDQTVYTMCAGSDEFCEEPYQPQTLGAQWYPFFPLQLWRVTGMLYARALVDNLIELVDEYNTRRTSAAEHRRKNKAVRIFNNASGITEAEITALNNRGDSTEFVGITGEPGVAIQHSVGSLDPIPYDPSMYDTSDILRDVEMVSGAQDASRGGVNQAKTATEAEIMAMGMQSRTAEQLDTIEDWMTSILVYCAQLLLLNKTEAEIKAAFGPDAVWPELSKRETFELVTVQIRAGSTAKPNKMRERDQWIQFLPQLQQAIGQIGELQQAGNEDMADALIRVLDETLRRFDERLSIKEFIPGLEGGEEGDQGQGGTQKAMEAGQAKLQQMMAEAQKVLDDREQQVKAAEDQLYRDSTALEVKRIEFDAQQTVAKERAALSARAMKMDARELAEDTVRRVTEIVDRYIDAARQAAQVGATVPVDGGAMVDEVHAVVAPVVGVLNPPEPAMDVPPM